MSQPINWQNHKKSPKRKRNPVLDYLDYIVIRLLVMIFSLLPMKTNLAFAAFCGRLLWKHYHRGRQRALENLRPSFPDKDDRWLHATGRRSFEHIVMLAMDMLLLPRLVKKDNWRKYSRFINIERAKWLMKEGKPLLLITGHYGNFEIVGYMLGLFGFNVHSIARPLDNPFISKYLYSVRQRKGQKIVDKKGASSQMQHLLASGATLCFLADQDAGRKGLFVDFFSRKASTYKSIALLAVTSNIPVGIGYSRRVDNKFFFEIEITRIIFPEEWAQQKDPIYWLTAEYTKEIENFIRRDPTQYWWLHRRWKHRPKNEQPPLPPNAP